jgi:flavin reductase (DIM6/NTAB) family NADH-FMN oxidoreductase RutF
MSHQNQSSVDGAQFREAMSRVAGAVHVIATNGPAGLGGATATSVTSVSDAPPSLLLCLNQSSATLEKIRANGAFSVSVLSQAQRDVAAVFSGSTGLDAEHRFIPGHGWSLGRGQPLLADALASFTCRLSALTPVGSHVIVIGIVEEARSGGDDAPLLYHRRGYRVL